MKYIKFALNWVTESTARTVTGLFVLMLVVGVGTRLTHAAAFTSYDVTNEPQMHLAVNITPTQTTGIILSAPQLNAANHTFATTTGAVLRIRYGSYQEDISYTSATVNSTTYQVTLIGVTRNLCPQVARSYVSCGNGRSWGIGAIVEENNDARLFNLKANIDRANTYTASGAISFSGSGSFTPPYFATTAARDQALGASPTGKVKMACVSATGLCYLSTNNTWTAIGSQGIGNASETTLGLVQLGTIKDQTGATVTGSSGAPTVVQTQYLTGSGGLSKRGRIPYLGANGFLSGSLLGTGVRSSTTALYGDQTYKAPGDSLIFGNGSNGAVTISTNTSLTADGFYTNLTINNGVTLNPNGWHIYVSGTLTINGTIASNGGNGTGGRTGGAGITGGSGGTIANGLGTLPMSPMGSTGATICSAGSAGNAGAAGVATTTSLGSNGVVGGAGGASSGQAGGAAGAAGTATNITSAKMFEFATRSLFTTLSNSTVTGNAGSGSGGSGGCADGGATGGAGGGSGAPGGNISIAAATIAGSGNINANGGNGGNGGAAGGVNNGGGGGGSTGAGGFVQLTYRTSTWSGVVTVTAGTTAGLGGAKTGGGTAGSAGTTAPAGISIIRQIQ